VADTLGQESPRPGRGGVGGNGPSGFQACLVAQLLACADAAAVPAAAGLYIKVGGIHWHPSWHDLALA